MQYFIYHVYTPAKANKKGRELQDFVKKLDKLLVADECSLDALMCDIEHQIKIVNKKYPRSSPVILNTHSFEDEWMWSIEDERDSRNSVCTLYYKKVAGIYTFSENAKKIIK